jgi:hypothetical protein
MSFYSAAKAFAIKGRCRYYLGLGFGARSYKKKHNQFDYAFCFN